MTSDFQEPFLFSGVINTSISSDPLFDLRVKILVRNEVTVRLRDSFMNPVASLEPKLRLQLKSANITTQVNASIFAAEEFVKNKDGSYTAHYVAKYLGSYGLCTQLDNTPLPPCPFEVHVLRGKASVGQMRFMFTTSQC